jgi:hypothetical protein
MRKKIERLNGLKWCHEDKHWVHPDNFGKNKHREDGLTDGCKECVRVRNERWRTANREQSRAASRASRAKYPEKAKLHWTKWYENNKEERSAYHKQYSLDNPEIMLEKAHRRRSKRISAYVEDVTRIGLRERDGDQCHYCPKTMYFGVRVQGEYIPEAAEIEHKLPLSRGGTHCYDNCVLACARCNRSKKDKTDDEYRDYLRLKTTGSA